MDHLLLDQFLNEYWNIETNIGEGCANAIATTWYRQFQNFLEIMSFENILGPICNQALIQPLTELMFEPQGYNISETYVCSEEKAYKLRHDACINEDYIVVSQTMWKFLDKYFKADYEIVLFVTKQPLEQQMFVQCENLNPGLCIPLKQIDLLIAVMSPMENTRFQIIHTPMSVLVSLDHFQQFVNDITMSKCCFQVDSKFFLYIDKKRVPLKGHRTLEKVGIKHTMQVVIAIQNLLLEDFEEERETDGEEMIEIEIADNLEERQEFVQKVEQAMSDIHYNLNIKSIEEIKQNLCQIECVYFMKKEHFLHKFDQSPDENNNKNMQKRNHSRVKLNETPRQFVIKSSNPKRSCSTNKSNPSSLNTSLSSSKLGFHEDKHHPEDGKLLDLIIEHENHQQSQIFNLQLSSFSIIEDQVEKRYAISDDPNNPQLRRNLTYNWYYHQDIQQNLISEHLIFGQSLRKQGIKEGLRAKMVDWMIEVYGNYSNTTTHQTFFRSVGIMDLFLKKTSQYFQDQELHLIGIVCMFIASKLEDIYHIPLMDFVNRVGHSKFTISQIKLMEQNILETLIYQVCFPTPLDYLQNVYYKCFSLNDSPQLLNIYETCIYIQKMCIHDYAMMGQPPSVLAAAIFGYAIKEYIESKQEGQKQLNQRIIKQSAEAIIKLVKIDFQSYYNCEKGVSDLINSFKQKYPELLNLEKFS